MGRFRRFQGTLRGSQEDAGLFTGAFKMVSGYMTKVSFQRVFEISGRYLTLQGCFGWFQEHFQRHSRELQNQVVKVVSWDLIRVQRI